MANAAARLVGEKVLPGSTLRAHTGSHSEPQHAVSHSRPHPSALAPTFPLKPSASIGKSVTEAYTALQTAARQLLTLSSWVLSVDSHREPHLWWTTRTGRAMIPGPNKRSRRALILANGLEGDA
jgi:hypothetical protein